MSSPDARAFRETIGLFATGVAVIIARTGAEVLAMTVNAVTSVSLDPMLVLFCPGKKTRFAQHVHSLTSFSINFLRHDQLALSSYFAGSWREASPPPFRFVPSACALRLEGSLAAIECEPCQVIDAGDHWLLLGQVLRVHTGIRPHQPLVFFGGQYRSLSASEKAPAPDLTNLDGEPAHIFYDRWSF
jgi:flavin reductase (DIM6/NTAB) family NADH-FMN oxidoreductase RutF